MLPYIQVNRGVARLILAHGDRGVARLILTRLDQELARLILTCLRSTDSYCIFSVGAQELACMDLRSL